MKPHIHILALSLLTTLIPLPQPTQAAKDSTPPPPKKNIHLIAGPKSHGPAGNGIHDYPWTAKLLTTMLQNSSIAKHINVHYHLNGWPKDQSPLNKADTIMIISDGRDGHKFTEALHLQSPQRIAFIQKQIDRGCGFITFHFSTFTPDKYAPQILNWTGAYFDWETDGKRKWYSAIKTLDTPILPASKSHPILNGVTPFKMREEFYYNLRFNTQSKHLTPLLKVPALKTKYPLGNVVAWAIQNPKSKSRGFGTTCGHFYNNFKNPNFRTFILNAITWTTHLKIPKTGLKTPFYTHQQIQKHLNLPPKKYLDTK